MLCLGLTGGTGAGKSTAAGRLAGLGAMVLDADKIAREVVVPGSPGLAAVAEAFGDAILLPDGNLDRPGLGRIVFGDEPARLRLNAILHPLIAARTADLVSAAPDDAVVVHDLPLIVENGLAAQYHLVIVVAAPAAQRVRRLVRGRGIPEQDAWQRVRAQAGDEQRRAVADVWLDNSGTPDELAGAIDALWRDRLAPYAQNLRLRRPAQRPAAVRVVDSDPTWPDQARRLRARIGAVVGGRALRIDHLGSTAVPGLAARDVVDLQVVVVDLAAADDLAEPLQQAGFARQPGWRWDDAMEGAAAGQRLHLACDPGRAVSLHVRVAGNPAVREQLLFRDWLRAHPVEREAYAAVTRKAAEVGAGVGAGAEAGVGVEEYLARKGPWIRAAMVRAAAWNRRNPHTPSAAPS